jgi:hypothetical protein
MQPDLLAKVMALESRVRRWKAITLLLILAMFTLLLAAAAPTQSFDRGFVQQLPSDRLLSHDFVLVGKDGKVYGRLTTRDNSPVMEFYDQKGKVIWSMTPKSNGYTPVSSR